MASLNTQTFSQIVSNITAAVQAAVKKALSFTIGSVELALAEAYASVVVWLQGLIAYVLSLTRAATSTGSDLDSWMADYAIVTRNAAIASTGQVTFSRFTYTQSATIPVGSQVQTSDGTQTFNVIADTTQPLYNSTQNAYIIPANTQTGNATVQAAVAGKAGNVAANTITVISSPIPYVDTVNNASAFTGGADAESDSALLARFQAALQSLREATNNAISSAISALNLGVQYGIVENQSVNGVSQPGYFYIAVNPYSSTIQSQIYSAVDKIRPIGTTFGVFAAQVITANIGVTVTVLSGYTHSSVASSVQTAINNFIGGFKFGQTLYYTQLYGVIYNVSGVQDATGLTINGGTSDITASSQQFISAGTITVN